MDKTQREYFLRQQLKAIQEELGETDEQQAEIAELRAQIEEAKLPEEADKQARRELDRLSKLPPAAAEYGVIRTYLEWILSLPWNETTDDDLDLKAARQILDEDHYDLDKVKERIVEHLAVQKLTNKLSGPILAFVGPPGVGKTSLGQSIARALGRKFVRVSVGGVRDEAEIRGHRRTYIGAMPGTIIRALRDAGTKNPVFMIDEIDKMGSDWRGDPSSAMLEVLDPAQNSTFRDHYLDLPFDLSQVLFVTTANQLETIPPPLLDRMEIIRVAGYTEDEKVGIARRTSSPSSSRRTGSRASGSPSPRSAAAARPRVHAGGGRAEPRPRDRRALPQGRARDRRGQAEGRPDRRGARAHLARQAPLLGRGAQAHVRPRRRHRPRRDAGRRRRALRRGHAMPGQGKLTVTGQIGDVMRESAQAALSWVRGHAAAAGLESDWFAERDVHIHVPAGAVPKDGPSAGAAMATALVSLATGVPVSEDVAMTGEITLTGQVLPIGGVKEKALAAERAGSARSSSRRRTRPTSTTSPTTFARRCASYSPIRSTTSSSAAFPGAVVEEFPRAARG